MDAPAEARRLAEELIERAAGSADLRTLADASVVLTQACLRLGDIQAADDAVERGMRAALEVGAADEELALRRLRTGVLSESGRAEEALTELELLLDLVPSGQRAAVLFSRAAVLSIAGRMDEAKRAYDEAIPELEHIGDQMRLAAAYANRANTSKEAGDLDGAEQDLRRAGEGFAALGSEHPERTARVHLAVLLAGRGRTAEALSELESVRTDDPAFALDEGHVLMDAHLIDEAVGAFRRAAEGFLANGQRSYSGVAQIELARAYLIAGNPDAAVAAAGTGADLVEESSGHAAEAGALISLARSAASVSPRELAALDRVGRRDAADTVRVRAALAAFDAGRHAVVRQLAENVAGGTGSGLRHRLRHHLASALLAAAEERTADARRSVAAGLSLLARHQAALGAVDLRAEAQGHGEALATLGLRLASQRRAIDLLLTSERCRAGTSRLPRPPVVDDPELGALLARLRSAQRRLDELDPLHDDRDRVRREIRSLERMVATRRRSRAGAGGRPTTVDERRLRNASHRAALVSFVDVDGELVRLDLVDGRCRRHDLGPVDELVGPIDGALRSMARLADRRLRPAMVAARRRAFEQDADQLAEHLLPGLDTGHPVVLVPTGRLHAIPWAALGALRSRPFVLAASLTGWLDAEERFATRHAEGLCAVAGPDLDEADEEVAVVAALGDGAAVLRGGDADGERVAEALRGKRIAHLAAHGRFRVDNPLLSGVELDDGILTVHDLERSAPTPPVVVLSACDLARAVVRPGDELLGLAAGLFALGTDSLVAAVVPVPDGSTRSLMEAFHRRVPTASLAEALAGSRVELLAGDPSPRDLVAAQAFCVIGAGLGT